MPTLVMSFSSGIYQNQPPLPFGVRKHQRRATVEIRFAMRAFEIGIEHRLLELRIAHAPAKFVREHRALSGRIDDDLGVRTSDASRPASALRHRPRGRLQRAPA